MVRGEKKEDKKHAEDDYGLEFSRFLLSFSDWKFATIYEKSNFNLYNKLSCEVYAKMKKWGIQQFISQEIILFLTKRKEKLAVIDITKTKLVTLWDFQAKSLQDFSNLIILLLLLGCNIDWVKQVTKLSLSAWKYFQDICLKNIKTRRGTFHYSTKSSTVKLIIMKKLPLNFREIKFFAKRKQTWRMIALFILPYLYFLMVN